MLASLRLAVAADQVVGRTVVLQRRLRRALKLRNDALRQHLAQFHAPLVERVDLPDGALREHAVLVERDQLAQRFRREPVGEDGVRRAIAFEHAVRHKPIRRALRLHLLRRLAERQRLALREDVGQQHVVMAAQRIERLAKGDEVAGNQPRALMDQLIERMLAVGSRLAPVNRTGLVSRPRSPSSVTCLPLLSIVNCCR